MEKPDWDAIAADYVEGAESMRAVARRFGVPLTTLRGHAQRERWEQRRRARQFEALGSIIENAGKLGAPIPEGLRRGIALLRDKTESGSPDKG